MREVAVLFARRDSFYKSLPSVDVWDKDRNALAWPGGAPVVAHPPCRAWASFAHIAKPEPGERDLAFFAVAQVRRYGGALEHPVASRLWAEAGLPAPGHFDEFGGWTLPIHQHWWGHRARKKTLLYIVGCAPRDIPPIPLVLGEATHVVAMSKDRRTADGQRIRKGHPLWRPEVSKSEREHTPPRLAEWLVAVARVAGGNA